MHSFRLWSFTFLAFLHPMISTRLISPKETDLAPTEEPYQGPDPWREIPCDFDGYTTCGWTNEHGVPDDFDWFLGEGRDSHRNRRKQKTGVKNDHGIGGGYMYIASGRTRNRTAKLVTGFFRLIESGCLKFWYNMRGRHMGHLKLYEFVTERPVKQNFEKDLSRYHLLWSVQGNQGQLWQQGVVPISKIDSSLRKRLVFEAFDWEQGVAGNIVLDDISFDHVDDGTTCNFTPASAAPPKTSTTPIATTLLVTSAFLDSTQMDSFFANTSTRVSSRDDSTTTSSQKTTSQVNTQSTVANNRTERSASPKTVEEKSLEFTTSKAIPTTQGPSTTGRLDGVEAKPKVANPALYIPVSVICGVLILGVALLLYWKHNRRNQSGYFDNCTVHMTRTSQEVVDPKDTVMQYYKLTDSDVKY